MSAYQGDIISHDNSRATAALALADGTVLHGRGFGATGIVAGITGVHQIRARIDSSLAREIGEFRELAGRTPDLDVSRLLHRSMQENVPDEHETFLGMLPTSTIVPVDGDPDLPADPAFRRAVTAHTGPAFGTYTARGLGEVRYAVMPVTGVSEAGEAVTAHFVVAYFVSKEMAELRGVVTTYVLTALPALLGVAAAAWLVSSAVLAPLRELRSTAARISATDVSERIDVAGTDEVADLAATVNSMLDRLSDALGTQRNMLDDVGHELRTPITVMRGHLELVDTADPADVATTREIVLDELDRMNALVSDMLTLAKSRRPDFLHRGPLDLASVVTDAVERARVVSAAHAVDVGSLDEVEVYADRNRLLQAVMQLVDNAVAVSPPGGRIAIGCTRRGARAQLWVRDQGPGIALADREGIFERHARATDSYDGTGLGLAIVAAIARAHGGDARVGESSPDGTTMVVEIPALAQEVS